MGREIERKFLLSNDDWRSQVADSISISQGYLTQNSGLSSVRIRLQGSEANINVKSREFGLSRQEYEYDIPLDDAEHMLSTLCTGVVRKTRHIVKRDGLVWEIDEFTEENQGLIVAELELNHEGQSFECPAWLGQEVTDDGRYYNVNLIDNPYSQW